MAENATISIIAQPPFTHDDFLPGDAYIYACELDRRLAKLQEEEAILRKQRENNLTYEEYVRWQAKFDKVNPQIVDILSELQYDGDE